MSFRWAAALFSGALAVSLSHPSSGQTGPQVCSPCHGVDGNSAQATFPNLAGQHAAYTTKQLANFKPQDGKAAERANAIMAGIVASMSADDMKNLGAYFENQKPQLRAARDPKLVQQGQAIYRGGVAARGVAACTGCHGPTGTGIPAQFPRLAGQYPEYTAAQLKAFRSGERGNDPNRMMRTIAEKLSDQEIAALADYISGLR